jgi:hypothetical protein
METGIVAIESRRCSQETHGNRTNHNSDGVKPRLGHFDGQSAGVQMGGIGAAQCMRRSQWGKAVPGGRGRMWNILATNRNPT